jgi:hypothetical protein
MREPTLIAATIGTAVAALRFRDDFRADRYDHIGCCHKLAFQTEIALQHFDGLIGQINT